ncbi:MAG TPA: hypothetical protein VGK74_01315 [Symbiobacteriaceae bacterium]|jgi:hypothetical protein
MLRKLLGKRPGIRLLALWILLVIFAMLRAERGTLELEGRENDPSHLFRLAPLQAGTGGWDLTVLGFQMRVPSLILLFDRGRAP